MKTIAEALAKVTEVECQYETDAHAARLMEDRDGYLMHNAIHEQIQRARRELQRAHILAQQFQREAEMLRHTEG